MVFLVTKVSLTKKISLWILVLCDYKAQRILDQENFEVLQ